MKAIRSAKKKDLPVGHPILPNQETMTEGQKKGRKELVRRLEELTKKAEKGEEGAVSALRGFLDEHPDLAWQLGDFARIAESVLLGELCKEQEYPVTEEGMRRQFAAMRPRFEHEEPLGPLPGVKPGSKSKNQPRYDARGHLARITGVDLAAVTGISASIAQTIISEIATDMRQFPTIKHFCS